ncbi:alkaline shock response membrane anchor protein AmaP [Levilactobacillus bambusae]|uniref:Alkaline shock response membrane anchor protein AmaP n=1 Tax=Levilactobacillus bambusae TaxID=2024736 RepID=A0A2V1MXF4_9LACO|nr:alkaline shock response membrane anchor protein AmaP [Levilactobacillus bambusae]PWF99492.1 alkaline shock response membrane anchor protein AmaP [Levilactobacillus bambusae]
MSRTSKLIVSLAGIVTLLAGIILLAIIIPIPYLTPWLHEPQPEIDVMITVAGALTALIGFCLLLVGLFKRTRLKQAQFDSQSGTLTIPDKIVEKDLAHQLKERFSLPDVHVRLKIARSNQVRGKITISQPRLSPPPAVEPMEKEANDYLTRLGFQVKRLNVQLTTETHRSRQPRVV